MADPGVTIRVSDPAPSCIQTVTESKITDLVLLASSVALLIIGILASTGIFESMGAANAAYLSYGMYAGAALFAVLEIAKVAVNCFKKRESIQDTTETPRLSHSLNLEVDVEQAHESVSLASETIEKRESESGTRDRGVSDSQECDEVKADVPSIVSEKLAQKQIDIQVQKSNELWKARLKEESKARVNAAIEAFEVDYRARSVSTHTCKITFQKGWVCDVVLMKEDIAVLLATIDNAKITLGNPPEGYKQGECLDGYFAAKSDGNAESVLNEIRSVNEKVVEFIVNYDNDRFYYRCFIQLETIKISRRLSVKEVGSLIGSIDDRKITFNIPPEAFKKERGVRSLFPLPSRREADPRSILDRLIIAATAEDG